MATESHLLSVRILARLNPPIDLTKRPPLGVNWCAGAGGVLLPGGVRPAGDRLQPVLRAAPAGGFRRRSPQT
eukprot:407506-Prorocentrum_minimum.AAC.2